MIGGLWTGGRPARTSEASKIYTYIKQTKLNYHPNRRYSLPGMPVQLVHPQVHFRSISKHLSVSSISFIVLFFVWYMYLKNSMQMAFFNHNEFSGLKLELFISCFFLRAHWQMGLSVIIKISVKKVSFTNLWYFSSRDCCYLKIYMCIVQCTCILYYVIYRTYRYYVHLFMHIYSHSVWGPRATLF